MVQGAMVLMRGVQIGSLYKLLGRRDTNGCVNKVIHEPNEISFCLVDSTMILHQRMGHIGEKVFVICTVKVWSKLSQIVLMKLISVNIVSIANTIMQVSHLGP